MDIVPSSIPNCAYCKSEAYLSEVRGGIFQVECLNPNCGLCGPKFLRAWEAVEAWRRIRFTSLEEEIRSEGKKLLASASQKIRGIFEKAKQK